MGDAKSESSEPEGGRGGEETGGNGNGECCRWLHVPSLMAATGRAHALLQWVAMGMRCAVQRRMY